MGTYIYITPCINSNLFITMNIACVYYILRCLNSHFTSIYTTCIFYIISP